MSRFITSVLSFNILQVLTFVCPTVQFLWMLSSLFFHLGDEGGENEEDSEPDSESDDDTGDLRPGSNPFAALAAKSP